MKQLERFPDYYITEDAQIISKRTKNTKVLKLNIDQYGYYFVGLMTSENKTSSQRIHRLMIETYGNLPPKDMRNPTVDHINGNKLDNRIENLQWLSNEDNSYKSSQSRIKRYTIEDENGNIFIVENLRKWCKDNNLCPSSLRRSKSKGWRHKGYLIIDSQEGWR